MLKRIRRDQTRLGMFIHGFEGSWFSHPFWRRRFLLTEAIDLAALLDSEVDAVIIDIEKGADVIPAPAQPSAGSAGGQKPGAHLAFSSPSAAPGRDLAAEQARAAATQTVNRAKKVMRDVFDGARLGKAIESAAVMAVVEDITDTIERNRHALLKVIRLKSKDEYTYLHSVAVCALMVNLARQLGLDEHAASELGTAGLLHDIGKMAVPSEVLNKPARLTDEEFALVQTHPEQGYRLLEDSGVPAAALDVCRHHHEKIDGTGYPHRLRGDEISLAARMGAICDVYDALTSNRPYKNAWSPMEAIKRMHSWQGQFDPDLLFAFMQSIGVFPVGMVVQLRSNRLGVVMDNGRRASRPKVLAFFSTREREFVAPEIVVAGEDLAHDMILGEANPAAWGITADQMVRFDQGQTTPLRRAG